MTYNKYGNKKTIIDNITFASLKEGNRYRELKLLLKAKEIKDLILQPKFLLQKNFKDYTGKIQRKIEYIADFQYKELGQNIVEDVKGKKTEIYKLKKKLFLFMYPKLFFKEV